jgi:hypothetical protein
MADAATVTVVIPLLRAREADLDGIAAWASQRPPGVDVEIVAASPGDPAFEGAATALLGPTDRIIVGPGLGESALWDLGARAALGDVLVLAECHSIPRPGSLEAALEALTGGLDVACFESVAPNLTPAAWVEDAVYQALFERYIDSGDPRAVSLRGIALRREIYLHCGGLRPDDHECFAERALAARLATAGARIGRAPGAVVEHVPNTRFRRLRQDSLDFHRDEISARLTGVTRGLKPDAFLELTPEWDGRARFDPSLNRAALPGVARLALSKPDARRRLPGMAVRAVTGPRLDAWAAAIRSRVTSAACVVSWRLGRRRDPFRTWAVLARASLLRVLSERSRTGVWAGRLRLQKGGAAIDADRLSAHAAGMHLAERFGNRPFRWTEPVVVLDLELTADAESVTVHLLELRKLGEQEVSVAWGRRPVPAGALDVESSTITVRDLENARGPLTISVTPLDSKGDNRKLGLPVVAVAAA